MFATAFCDDPDPAIAVRTACEALKARLPEADLIVALAGGYECDELKGPLESIQGLWSGQTAVAGGTVSGVICRTHEHEQSCGLVLWAGKFPQGHVHSSHLQFVRTAEGGLFTGGLQFQDRRGVADQPYSASATMHGVPAGKEPKALAMLLADPFSFPADLLIDRMQVDFPGVPVIGGMLSQGDAPRENLVLVGDRCYRTGCAGVVISGDVSFELVVSQGCRPIGSPMIVTAAEQNEILGLGGQAALDRLMEVFRSLPVSEQQMVNQGLLLGVATSEYRESFGYGDFLIRPVMGVVEDRKSLAIGDFVRIGKTVQFHVRDHESAGADLRQQLEAARKRMAPCTPRGGLLFTCNGRGTHMFPESHHDARAFGGGLEDFELAGFFAAGEIGPVGDHSFVHGHTATGVLFGQEPDTALKEPRV